MVKTLNFELIFSIHDLRTVIKAPVKKNMGMATRNLEKNTINQFFLVCDFQNFAKTEEIIA